MRLHTLSCLGPDFQIVLADVGSAGGLHRRWRPLADHLTTILSDPLDQTVSSKRDIYLPFALASAQTFKRLFVTRRVTMTSMLKPNVNLLKRFWAKPAHTEIVCERDVPVAPLDPALVDRGMMLDAIKIDVQGGELDVINGAQKALSRDVITAEIEVSFLDRYAGQPLFWDIHATMQSLGFELIDLSRIKRYRHHNSADIVDPRQGWGKRTGRIAFCDALYVAHHDRLLAKSQDPRVAVKAMLLLITYGKADMAAQIFDQVASSLNAPVRNALGHDLKRIARRDWGKASLHRILDYLASKS